jgi:DNA-binding NarL/FixJ family response regulator
VAQILIADDHDVLRRGLRALLSRNPRWEVCGEAVNGEQAVKKVRELKPDLVILDISMPVMNGLQAAEEISRVAPSVKILIFSMHDSPQLAEAARQAGADAFVQKSSPSSELIGTLQHLLDLSPAKA